MFGADALCYALTLTTEDKSRNQRVACQEIRETDGRYTHLAFRSIGEVFPLTTEGHIDVIPNLAGDSHSLNRQKKAQNQRC